jgi:26S proteasome regulatory subunit N8
MLAMLVVLTTTSLFVCECLQVGVEHLLRDINDPSTSTLANQIKHKMAALSGLRERLEEVKLYLARVLAGTLPVNNQIVYNLQDIFNLLPNLNAEVKLIAVQ